MKRRKCRYLTGKAPRLFDMDLACIIGLNEAIFVNQLDYWLTLNEEVGRNFRDGHCWAYNSYKGWQIHFPCWQVKTIQRIITSLEKKGILITDNFNKLKMDRTKWYRLDYDMIDSLELPPDSFSELISGNGEVNVTKSMRSNCPNAEPSTFQPNNDLSIKPEDVEVMRTAFMISGTYGKPEKDEENGNGKLSLR